MSEPGLTSDKIIVKSSWNVRTWSDFGQSHQEKPEKCPTRVNFGQSQREEPEKRPNLGQLRTKSTLRAGEISESVPESEQVLITGGNNYE
ncbi:MULTISPECIES: hypothetical protein [unclassified Mesobacillus]|uniref:hypothetical protein n=1 Tax=unclassified Mesobacillus TaxID=2675270 RepID=UPI0020426058|nr:MULTISPECIES: hypothetical protein [unclassified Mesobacillus]MCM3125234.1 hypothetical protein [Mesobacillus sp. MER 33]MCM3235335.1 hypothetical protein [Mesobacillus sp. MER 48]